MSDLQGLIRYLFARLCKRTQKLILLHWQNYTVLISLEVKRQVKPMQLVRH